MDVEFSDLVGKTLTHITVIKDNDERDDIIYFATTDGLRYKLYHEGQCCESVDIAEIVGDIDDLIGSPILQAEEADGIGLDDPEMGDWTFYKLATIKGSVTIRWLGRSSGDYSTEVSFDEDIYDQPEQWEMYWKPPQKFVPDPAVAGLVYDPSSCSWVKP